MNGLSKTIVAIAAIASWTTSYAQMGFGGPSRDTRPGGTAPGVGNPPPPFSYPHPYAYPSPPPLAPYGFPGVPTPGAAAQNQGPRAQLPRAARPGPYPPPAAVMAPDRPSAPRGDQSRELEYQRQLMDKAIRARRDALYQRYFGRHSAPQPHRRRDDNKF